MLYGSFVSISRLPLFALIVICAGLTFAGQPETGVTISWERSYAGGVAKSKADSKILFLAVNMDAEAGNDRTVKNIYSNPQMATLTTETVNLIASTGQHRASGDCPHLGAVTCKEHRSIDGQARSKVLVPDAAGHVVAPQHIWLNPSGEVLLSVPYEISMAEMQWCFYEAARLLDPENASSVPTGGKRPKRAIIAGVEGTTREALPTTLTEEEIERLVLEIRQRKLPWAQLYDNYERLRMSTSPAAREQIKKYLNQMKPVPGGGSPMIRDIGGDSPIEYWDILTPFASDPDTKVRNEVAVALEQLAVPESLKQLTKQYKKEKDPQVRKNLLRAISACGPNSKAAQSLVLKAAKQSKDDLLRRNALICLGLREPSEDGRNAIQKALKGDSEMDRFAAVVAMGLSHDDHWDLALAEASMPSKMGAAPKKKKKKKRKKKGAVTEKPSIPIQEIAQTAIIVRSNGQTSLLRAARMEACGDTIPRRRGL